MIKKDVKDIDENNLDNHKTCFIVTPIGEAGSETRRHIDGIIDAAIVPILEEGINGMKYTYEVAHRLYDSTTIVKQIYEKLVFCDLVIANLTWLNPNVMYELAIRFCIGKPTIVIANFDTKLPFDIKDQRVLFYVNDAQGILDLKVGLKNILKTIDYNGEPNSPVYDAVKEIQFINTLKTNKPNSTDINALSMILERINDINNKININIQQEKVFTPNFDDTIQNVSEMIWIDRFNELQTKADYIKNNKTIDTNIKLSKISLLNMFDELMNDFGCLSHKSKRIYRAKMSILKDLILNLKND